MSSSAISAVESRLLHQAASFQSWANTVDRSARTLKARQALENKFLAEADGDPLRAEALRKAHFTRMAAKSVQARRKAREWRAIAASADAELAAGLAAVNET